MLEEKKASDLGIESYVTLKRLETVIVPLGTEPYFKIFPVKGGKKIIVLGSTWAASIYFVPEDKVMH